MKPNFFAFDAIAYSIQAGATHIPTFARRGWAGIALVVVSGAFFLTNLVNLANGFADPEFADFFYRAFAEVQNYFNASAGSTGSYDGLTDEDAQLIGSFFTFYGAYFIGLILMVPGFVDVYRRSAGLPVSEGSLPTFGAAEWNLIIIYILLTLLTLPFVLLVGGAAVALGALAFMAEVPWLAIFPGIAALVVMVWFSIRIALIPAHVALTGGISFFEAFTLVQGRAWKFLGTSFLFGAVMGALTIGVSYFGQGLDFLLFFGSSLILGTVLSFYRMVATTAFHGRIASERRGLRSDGELVQADELEDDIEDFVEDDEPEADDDGDLLDIMDEAASVDTAEESPSQSFGQPMRRREPGFVPRRLR